MTALGKQTFRGACAKCHGFRREGLIGPAITPAAVENAEALETLIRQGRGGMPAVGKGWEDNQLTALIEYLKSAESSGG